MSLQADRDVEAQELIQRAISQGADAAFVLDLITESAASDSQRDFTPHLIRAAREAGLWPAIQRAHLRDRNRR